MTFVIDASITLAFAFPDERDDVALAVAAELKQSGAVAPMIWAWEVQNAVVVSERRNRLSSEGASALLQDLGKLPIGLEQGSTFGNEASLARRFKLSIYDALYLELALRKGLPLATRDRSLAAAATELDVATRGLLP